MAGTPRTSCVLFACCLALHVGMQELKSQAEDGATGTRLRGTAAQCQSANFVVTSRAVSCDAREIAALAEQWRSRLVTQYGGDQRWSSWATRCEIQIHASAASYYDQVGREVGTSFGASWLEFREQQVVRRRVDLRSDEPQRLPSALAHELTHVVLADCFRGRQPPRWADEGLAMLADSIQKQQRHHRDLIDALHAGRCMPLGQLLNSDYPPPEQTATFYAQSLSLTQYLVTREPPRRFVQFVLHAMAHGYDHSLREHYGIADAAELERQWRESLSAL